MCFKWAVFAALHQEEITKDPQGIPKLQHYEDQYKWEGPESQLAIQKIGKFEKNHHDIAVNVIFNRKKGIYTLCRSERNGKCNKQTNFIMKVNEENRNYTVIKNISRLLKAMNAVHKEAHHCLNGAYYC